MRLVNLVPAYLFVTLTSCETLRKPYAVRNSFTALERAIVYVYYNSTK
jgi:hypothetical protein